MKFFDKLITNLNESEKEHKEMHDRVIKSLEETKLRMNEKQKKFDEKRKKREKYFNDLG